MKSNELKELLVKLYTKKNFSPTHAGICAWHTTLAEEWGVKTHGINLLEWYMQSIDRGTINSDPEIIIESKNDTFKLLKAGRAHGQIATYLAAEEAINSLNEGDPISFVGITNSNHFGMGGAPTYQIAKAGYIGILLCSTPPIIAPAGGAEKGVGSNPVSIGFPLTGREPLNLDMSLSVNALNKIVISQREGKPIPDFSYLNKDGEYTTNIDDINVHKCAAPLGGYLESSGYKGYGLAFMTELLTACLLGGLTSEELFSWNRDEKGPAPESHVVIAIKPDIYCSKNDIEEKVLGLMKFVKARKKAKNCSEILIPGEDRYQNKLMSDQGELNLTDWQMDILHKLSDKYDLG